MRSEISVFTNLEKGVTIAKSDVIWSSEKCFERLFDNNMLMIDTSDIFPALEKMTVKVKLRDGDTMDVELGEKLAKAKLYKKYHRRVTVYLNKIADEMLKAQNLLEEVYMKHIGSYINLCDKFEELAK